MRAQEDVMSFLHIGSWGRQHVFCLGWKWSGDPPTEFTKNPRWGETFPQQKGDVRPGKRFPFAASNFELSDMNRNVSCVPGLSVEGVSHRI